jgi:hypothetical protein
MSKIAALSLDTLSTYAWPSTYEEGDEMGVFMGAFPVLPGKEDDARKFAQETMERVDEFAASQTAHGITREEWSFQPTPDGALVLVRFESSDPAASLQQFGESDSEFDQWSRSRIKEVTGVDMSEPGGEEMLPEIILDWTAEEARTSA